MKKPKRPIPSLLYLDGTGIDETGEVATDDVTIGDATRSSTSFLISSSLSIVGSMKSFVISDSSEGGKRSDCSTFDFFIFASELFRDDK